MYFSEVSNITFSKLKWFSCVFAIFVVLVEFYFKSHKNLWSLSYKWTFLHDLMDTSSFCHLPSWYTRLLLRMMMIVWRRASFTLFYLNLSHGGGLVWWCPAWLGFKIITKDLTAEYFTWKDEVQNNRKAFPSNLFQFSLSLDWNLIHLLCGRCVCLDKPTL
jgi:hypothetical protein